MVLVVANFLLIMMVKSYQNQECLICQNTLLKLNLIIKAKVDTQLIFKIINLLKAVIVILIDFLIVEWRVYLINKLLNLILIE